MIRLFKHVVITTQKISFFIIQEVLFKASLSSLLHITLFRISAHPVVRHQLKYSSVFGTQHAMGRNYKPWWLCPSTNKLYSILNVDSQAVLLLFQELNFFPVSADSQNPWQVISKPAQNFSKLEQVKKYEKYEKCKSNLFFCQKLILAILSKSKKAEKGCEKWSKVIKVPLN